MKEGMKVKNINSADELFIELEKLNKDNSVLQFSVPGKGKFTLVMQESDFTTIQEDVDADDGFKKMIHESRNDYKEGRYKTTSK